MLEGQTKYPAGPNLACVSIVNSAVDRTACGLFLSFDHILRWKVSRGWCWIFIVTFLKVEGANVRDYYFGLLKYLFPNKCSKLSGIVNSISKEVIPYIPELNAFNTCYIYRTHI